MTPSQPVTTPLSFTEIPIPPSQEAEFRPIKVLQVELGQELPVITVRGDADNQVYERALCLVRLHTQPLGLVDVPLPPDGLMPDQFAAIIWFELAERINAHLIEDGLPTVERLSGHGLPVSECTACLTARHTFLQHAPFVSVIIPTRDRPDVLAGCLRSILASEYPDYEIIVVDNAPRTSAVKDLIEREYTSNKRIRYAREDRSGSAAARNKGLESARGDIVAFTDDDVVVDRYWLAELAAGFDAADNVACVTGLILPLELQTPAQLWFEEYGGFSKGFSRRVWGLGKYKPTDPLFPYNAGCFGSGNSMAFRRATLAKLGNFDPTLGNGTPALGGVDVESFLRVIVKGYQLVYQPTAIIHHLHRRDYAGLRSQVYNYGVGMTALLTKTLLANPAFALDFLRKIPIGVRFALNPNSALNALKRSDYPPELTRLDRVGMLYGPLAYVRSLVWWHITLRVRGRHIR